LTSPQVNKSQTKPNQITADVRNAASCCLFIHYWHLLKMLTFTHWSSFSETERTWNLKLQQKCMLESSPCLSHGYCTWTVFSVQLLQGILAEEVLLLIKR
jgi:hypothetical protein